MLVFNKLIFISSYVTWMFVDCYLFKNSLHLLFKNIKVCMIRGQYITLINVFVELIFSTLIKMD